MEGARRTPSRSRPPSRKGKHLANTRMVLKIQQHREQLLERAQLENNAYLRSGWPQWSDERRRAELAGVEKRERQIKAFAGPPSTSRNQHELRTAMKAGEVLSAEDAAALQFLERRARAISRAHITPSARSRLLQQYERDYREVVETPTMAFRRLLLAGDARALSARPSVQLRRARDAAVAVEELRRRSSGSSNGSRSSGGRRSGGSNRRSSGSSKSRRSSGSTGSGRRRHTPPKTFAHAPPASSSLDAWLAQPPPPTWSDTRQLPYASSSAVSSPNPPQSPVFRMRPYSPSEIDWNAFWGDE